MNRSRYQFSPASLALVVLLTLLIGAGLGLALAYALWPVPESRDVVITRIPAPEPTPASEPSKQVEPAYRRLAREAERLVAEGAFAQAMERLIEAELVAPDPGAASWIDRRLEQTSQAYATALSVKGQDDLIDGLYQRLTFAMPEKAVFFLRLAEHRIDSGLPESALPVLSQIENHQQYGARARQLMAGIAREASLAKVYSQPLQKRGDQYLVLATIDGQAEVTLLVDTGASMTVLTPSVLSALGYRLDGDRVNFSTANGLVMAPLVQIEQIAIGEVVVESMTVGALALGSSEQAFDGLLGMNFLRQFEFSLDQEALQLRLKVAGAL